MIILDTNVLSALMLSEPERAVVEWLDRQPRASIWITSVTALEIRFALAVLPAGRRRSALTGAFEKVLDLLEQRIAAFDAEAAERAADLMAVRKKRGRPVDLRDTMIAGIVLAQRAVLATRNTAHFAELSPQVVNPWTD